MSRRERAKQRARAEAIAARRHGVLPILGGLAIDVADVITLGGLGGVGGAMIGALITYGVCSQQGLSRFNTFAFSLAGAVYCALPFTEALPLATLIAITSQLVPRRKALPETTEPAAEPIRVSQVGHERG